MLHSFGEIIQIVPLRIVCFLRPVLFYIVSATLFNAISAKKIRKDSAKFYI